MNFSLNQLYQAVGVSKQAYHQRMDRQISQRSQEHQLLHLVYQIRQDHPTMGCRDIYYKIQPDFMGRDKFEAFCKAHGLSSKKPVNYRRTTDSSGVIRFVDITIGLELTGINQVWVSDITYFQVGDKFCYLTFITDSFSRRILGYSVSRRLFTDQTTLPALQMAIKARSGMNIQGTIFHSDGGGQYYQHEFLKLTARYNLRNSMCEYPWDNGKAERINGVIKNNYLAHRDIKSYEHLVEEVARTVRLYNEEKPHIRLKRLMPIEFEKLYLHNREMSDGEKSTTECNAHQSRVENCPGAVGEMSSSSNITQEYNLMFNP